MIDATSFALTCAGLLYFLRFAILANPNTNESRYDSGVSRWWRFVERLVIVTIISCYASVAVFLATIINNNPKHRNRVRSYHHIIISSYHYAYYSHLLNHLPYSIIADWCDCVWYIVWHWYHYYQY